MSTEADAQFERIEAKLDELLDALRARVQAPPVRWLTVEGAAQYASLCDASLRRLIDEGKLTAHRPRKGRILIDVRQLDSLIAGSTTRPRTGRGLARKDAQRHGH